MRLQFNRPYDHNRGEKGGTIRYAGGMTYDVPDELVDVLTGGDDPIAFDPSAPDPAPVEPHEPMFESAGDDTGETAGEETATEE